MSGTKRFRRVLGSATLATLALAGMAAWSMVETLRCAERTWSLYYAGVLILLYSEVMILGMAIFLFFFP